MTIQNLSKVCWVIGYRPLAIRRYKRKEMRQKRMLVKIHSAAFYFVHISRDIKEIAKVFGVSTHAIRKWAKTEEWSDALKAFNYESDTHFSRQPRRDTARDAGEVFEKARDAYIHAYRSGEPTRKLATIAGNAVGLSRRRIHAWAKQYRWREIAKRSSGGDPVDGGNQ